jgi:folylpolyglutamate synthase/dihydropteroate synthase
VCAMSESILRFHGLKTGLYVSPHLLEQAARYPSSLRRLYAILL